MNLYSTVLIVSSGDLHHYCTELCEASAPLSGIFIITRMVPSVFLLLKSCFQYQHCVHHNTTQTAINKARQSKDNNAKTEKISENELSYTVLLQDSHRTTVCPSKGMAKQNQSNI